MKFLIRVAFWLSVVVLLLPADPPASEGDRGVSAFQAIGAARDTVADVSGFCDRNPNVCATGEAFADLMVRKAQYGTRLVAGYLGDFRGEKTEAAPPELRGTLTGEDLVTPWQQPRPPGKV